MSEGFKQFDDLSKGLYGTVIAIDVASINGLLYKTNESMNALMFFSFAAFLISIFIIITGTILATYHSKEEGWSGNSKKKRDINRSFFWYLLGSAFFSLLGLLILCLMALIPVSK